MKRTDRLTNLIAFLLFAAFAAYVIVYAVHALGNATVTAEAVAAELELSGVASGIVVREETLLVSEEPFIDVTAAEGEKLAAGTPIATAVQDAEGLEKARHIHELEREIRRVYTALGALKTADEVTGREESLSGAARNLAAAVARHDTAALDGATLSLDGLLLGEEAGGVSAETLSALQRELVALQGEGTESGTVLTAEAAGVYSGFVDGYEHLGSAALVNLTPSKLQALIDAPAEPQEGTYGKLVRDFRWYFAGVMSSVDAAKLTRGKAATLNFGRWYSADIPARVVSVGPSEDGNVVAVFRCDTALADTLSMRGATASVVFDSYSGIRIPAEAVRTDDKTEGTYVWTITAMQLERKDIEILYAGDDYVIVRRGTTADALREGNTVVVSGTDLREGKVME